MTNIHTKDSLAKGTSSPNKNEPSIVLFSLDNNGILFLLEGSGIENLGLLREELVGRSIHEKYKNKPKFIEHLSEAVNKNLKSSAFKSGKMVFDVFCTTLQRNSGDIGGYIGFAKAVSEDKVTGLGLRDQNIFLEQYFENSPDAIVILGNDGTVLKVNKNFSKIFGYTSDEMAGKDPNYIFIPENLSEEVNSMARELSDGKVFRKETLRKRKDGSLVDVSVIAYKFTIGTTDEILTCGIYSDITARKKVEEKISIALTEKELLLREVHHRVKNTLQTISSILNIQGRFVSDMNSQRMLKESQNRLKSIAFIHEKLYQTHNVSRIDFSTYAKSLTSHLFSSYKVPRDRIVCRINSPNIFLGLDAAIPCGLIINELVSNSIKHAFPEEKKGEINIELEYDQRDNFILHIRDNGIGYPGDINFKNSETFGLQLVMMLLEQLEGEIVMNKINGTEYRITFPNKNLQGRL